MIWTATLLLEPGLATRTKQSMFDARWEGQRRRRWRRRRRRRRPRRRWRRATEFCFSKTKDASEMFWWKSNLGSRKVQRFIWQSKKNDQRFLRTWFENCPIGVEKTIFAQNFLCLSKAGTSRSRSGRWLSSRLDQTFSNWYFLNGEFWKENIWLRIGVILLSFFNFGPTPGSFRLFENRYIATLYNRWLNKYCISHMK